MSTQGPSMGEPSSPPPLPHGPKQSPVKKFCKGVYKVVSSHVGLIIILVIYSFIGAALFQFIEGGHEQEHKSPVIEVRENMVSSLWNKTQKLGGKEAIWQNLMRNELKKYEKQIQEAISAGVASDSETDDWDFWGSLLYCATVYTTIGYGHIAPVTTAGRIVTMLYATIGIPLCLIVMADLGKLFTRAIKFPWAFIRRCYHTGECKKPAKQAKPGEAQGETSSVLGVEMDADFDEFNLPPIIAIVITIAYILLGAALYCQWEEWTYLEAFYFIFISISTIGFGDVLPEHPKYFLASSIYILVGLSLVAMVINVIMEVVSSTIDKATGQIHSVGVSLGIPMPGDEDEEVVTKQD